MNELEPLIEGLRQRRRYLIAQLLSLESFQAELPKVEAALIAFGELEPNPELVCPYCDHVPFANQRAKTRHMNKEHPAQDMSDVLDPPNFTPDQIVILNKEATE